MSAVNSALHRARVTLAKHYHPDEREMAQVSLTDAATNALLSRYVQAWETDDVAGLVALLKEDATLSMPPFPSWFGGREAIRAILTSKLFGSGGEEVALALGCRRSGVCIRRVPMPSRPLPSIEPTKRRDPIGPSGFKSSPSTGPHGPGTLPL